MPAPLKAASGRSPARLSRGGTLKQQWIKHALAACNAPATFYTGARKIIRPMKLVFTSLDDSLRLSDAGYTSSKLTALTKHYLHPDSRDIAQQLWLKRREQAKYGSVGFSTYSHLVKGGGIDAKRSKRASVFGPCIQSVIITWLDKQHYSVDVFYRTTELLKKFPADLVLIRDVLLAGFDFTNLRLHELTCHFANVTVHSMYFATIVPHLEEPHTAIDEIKDHDKFWANWVIKWTARYVCPQHHRGIAKFSQALRVQKDIKSRLTTTQIKQLEKYLNKNHPGFRGEYKDVDREKDPDTDEDVE